jgi:hypothetical protein
MAENFCPVCGKPIAMADINIQEGVGLCRACGKLSRLSEIAEPDAIDPASLAQPPAGCTWGQFSPQGYMVRASTRSVGSALGLGFVCLFWNGIVSVFVLLALAGLYTNLIGPLPSWFPAPTNSGKHGHGDPMSLGMTLFLCIFLTPFVAVGTGLLIAFLMSLFGRIEVVVESGQGIVRTGFGPFNWTRRFDASKVRRITTGVSSVQNEGGKKNYVIQIVADRTIKFGLMLPDERRAWMIAAMRNVLQVYAGGNLSRAAHR